MSKASRRGRRLVRPRRARSPKRSKIEHPTSDIDDLAVSAGLTLPRSGNSADHLFYALRPGFLRLETEQLFGGFQIEMETLERLARSVNDGKADVPRLDRAGEETS